MEDSYIIEDAPMMGTGNGGLSLSPMGYGRLARYQARAIERLAMDVLDMQCLQTLCAKGIAGHVAITGMARQAAEMYPEAADRFNSIAVQNYCHIAEIIDDNARGR